MDKKSKLLSVLTLVLLLSSVINLPNVAAISCVAPTDNGPITSCNYTSQGPLLIVDGLPPGTTIEIEIVALSLHSIMITPLGGGEQTEKAMATLDMTMTGTGVLTGYNHHLQMPISFEAHTDPRTLGTTPQSFDTDMTTLFGQLTNPDAGDPEFDLLRITAGTGFGLPSPGHTTLTKLGGGDWQVDSFFDIEYRIDFIGKFGGQLSGSSGSTTRTIRILSDGSSAVVGGELIPIDSTSLLLAGAQTPIAWMMYAFSAIGIGAFLFTKNPNNMRNIKVILRDYLDRF